MAAKDGEGRKGTPPIMKRTGPPPTIEGKAKDVTGNKSAPGSSDEIASNGPKAAEREAGKPGDAPARPEGTGKGSETRPADPKAGDGVVASPSKDADDMPGATVASTDAGGSKQAAAASANTQGKTAPIAPANPTAAAKGTEPKGPGTGASSSGGGSAKTSTSGPATRPTTPPASPSGGGTPPRPPADRQGASGGGFGRLAAAALLGGVVGAGLLWLLNTLGGEDDARVAELETLQARVASLETAEPIDIVDTEALEARFALVEGQLAALPPGIAPEEVSSLGEALAALEAELTAQSDRLEALASTAPSSDVVNAVARLQADLAATQQRIAGLGAVADGASGEQIALLSARIEQLEERPVEIASGDVALADPAELNALRGEVAAVRDAVAAIVVPDVSQLATSGDLEAVRARIDELAAAREADRTEAGGRSDALRDQVAQLSTRLEEVRNASTDERAALTSRVEELSGRLDGIGTRLDELASTDEALRTSLDETGTLVRDVQQRIGEVGGTVDDIVVQLDRPGDRERAVAAVALAGLQGAVDRGEGYATYLNALTSSGVVSNEDASVLTGNAEGGVPTRATLVARWETLAADARRAAVRSEATTGVASLLAGARSLVDVSPSDPSPGSGVPATVARISSQLRAGALADALATWETLPQASRAATRAWAQDARTRLAVEAALANANEAVLSRQLAPASDG